jgi:hypothetical protein
MHVSLWDYDTITSVGCCGLTNCQDDMVGETIIDLENRLLSECRATCGLPKTFTLEDGQSPILPSFQSYLPFLLSSHALLITYLCCCASY